MICWEHCFKRRVSNLLGIHWELQRLEQLQCNFPAVHAEQSRENGLYSSARNIQTLIHRLDIMLQCSNIDSRFRQKLPGFHSLCSVTREEAGGAGNECRPVRSVIGRMYFRKEERYILKADLHNGKTAEHLVQLEQS